MVVVLELVPCISNYQIRTLWEQKFFTMVVKTLILLANSPSKSPNLLVKLTSYKRVCGILTTKIGGTLKSVLESRMFAND